MKKLFAILLAVALFASMATVVSAANTTTLTTTVPAATYTLNIPANQEIPFGNTSTEIGTLTVTDEIGFAVGKNLKVTITYSDFTCEDTTTTIPMEVKVHYESTSGADTIASGDSLVFYGTSAGKLQTPHNSGKSLDHISVAVNSSDWGKALAGEYTATITFTAEVVAR